MEQTGPICIVDDEQSIRETLEAVLKDEGYQVVSSPNAEHFEQQLKEITPSLVLLDIWLPGRDGMSVLESLRLSHPDLPVLMMSGHAGIESAVSAIKLGARDFLEKPLHLEVILDKIATILSRKRVPVLDELPSDTRLEEAKIINRVIPEESVFLEDSEISQKTLKKNVVLNGKGFDEWKEHRSDPESASGKLRNHLPHPGWDFDSRQYHFSGKLRTCCGNPHLHRQLNCFGFSKPQGSYD